MAEERNEIVVFIVRSRDSRCAECGEELGRGGFLRKEGERGLCLDCADLGGLVYRFSTCRTGTLALNAATNAPSARADIISSGE